MLLRQASDHLHEDGLLVVEVGNSQDVLCEIYPDVPFIWIDFERGGDGVFVLEAAQLATYRDQF